jgi:hypothetical protein
MASIENNSDDWREIRSRVDSIANAVFLLAGGALSLSVSVLVDGKAAGIVSAQVADLASTSWLLPSRCGGFLFASEGRPRASSVPAAVQNGVREQQLEQVKRSGLGVRPCRLRVLYSWFGLHGAGGGLSGAGMKHLTKPCRRRARTHAPDGCR